MNKPPFDPTKPFEASKPVFDPTQPFESTDAEFAKNRENIEPGVMGETEPPEQKLLNNINAAGAGFELPRAAAALAKPVAEFAAPQLERIARNQTLKSMGGSLRQIREMAKKGGLDEAAKFAREKGLTDVFSTSLGRENKLEALEQAAGSKLGALRAEGGASPLTQADLEAKVMADPKMAKYLGEGLQAGQARDVPKALADIQRVSGANPTFASRAEAATELNQSAAGNKLYQPTSATTDVANILSRENNQGLASALGPEKAAQEAAARSEFSHLQPLKHLQEHGELREISGHNLGLLGTAKSLLPTGMVTRATAKGTGALGELASDVAKAPNPSIGGVTSNLMRILSDNPTQLGRYATPLFKAAQTGGNQGLAATHYILSTTHPDYNELIANTDGDYNANR